MNAFYIILATCLVLLLGAIAFLALIAVGVRRGGHGDLASPASTRIDAITRQAVGLGTRSNKAGDS